MDHYMSVRNATHAATAWAATPVGVLVRVEVLVTVSCTLLATLVFFGSSRRTSRSAVLRFVVWLVLMLCYPAVSYTIGLIQSGSFRNDLVVVWACFLLGCADGIFACSVDDSDQQARRVLNQGTQVIYVFLLLVSYNSSLELQLQILLLLLWVLNVNKLGMRLWSLLSAGRDRVLTADNWLISKHMAHEHVRSIWDFDPDTMKGYKYMVTGEKHVQDGSADYKKAEETGEKDVEQGCAEEINQGTQVVYVFLLLISYVSSLELQLQILLLLLWVLNVGKLGMRLWSLLSAGRDRVLTADNWLISKYMAREYVRSISDFDPGTMKGYKYMVTGEKHVQDGSAEYKLKKTGKKDVEQGCAEEIPDDLVTVDRVWQYEGSGSLLSNDKTFAGKLKDLCLSFALFKLLRRRLSRNPLHENDDIRTLVFVRRGLAGGDSRDDYKRMFRVIEVELGFLFDFFYARYPSPKQSLVPETAILVAAVALSLSTLLSPALMRYHNPQAPGNSSFVTTGLDIWFAMFVIVLFVILELFQYFSLVLSDWHKVKMLCRYVRKPSWQGHPITERLLWLMCRATLTTRYWSNSVGQYSLLHGCLQNNRSCLLRMWLHKWIRGQLVQMTTVSRRSLPVTVKCAIHQLVHSEWLSNLKYGDRTLQRNNMLQNFDWSTSRYQHGAVGSILVWHIATIICGGKKSEQQDTTIAESREVATTLSEYCAYLLFQAPELVTDQIYDARLLMEALQLRIQRFLKENGCRSKDDMFEKLSGFHSGELKGACEEDILADGIKLGNQILEESPDEAVRWKVLSEMWVELLLSAAPSDNVTAHVKKLATGGELITHLWALLTHGGIIDKPKKPQ